MRRMQSTYVPPTWSLITGAERTLWSVVSLRLITLPSYWPSHSPVRGPRFVAGLGYRPYPKSFFEHIGQYHVRVLTIPTYGWWWCLIAWLLPGGYDPRTKMVEGRIQTPFTFWTSQKVQKAKHPSHMAPNPSANLPAEKKHPSHGCVLAQTTDAPERRANESWNLSGNDDNGGIWRM